MIGRQGILVHGFRDSSLVQPLRSQKSLNLTDTGIEVNSIMHYSTMEVMIIYSKMKLTSLHWR